VGRPEEMIPLGRPRHKWEDNIIMDLTLIRLEFELDSSGSG
jgi:hypothetical protein